MRHCIALLSSLLLLAACNLPGTTLSADLVPREPASPAVSAPGYFGGPPPRAPGEYPPAPTPDTPHPLLPLRTEAERYTVQPGDTLGLIANRFGLSLARLIEANAISDPNLLSVGQVLEIPPPQPGAPAPIEKLIPDSELVNSTWNQDFDLAGFIQQYNGQLAIYRENIDGQTLTGAQIVTRVGHEYSVNPRLLLAVLEYQSGWVTRPAAHLDDLAYPVGVRETVRSGLYRQLAWAANALNTGYYAWRVNSLNAFTTRDGVLAPAEPTLNAGTIGLQYLFANLYEEANWRAALSETGFIATYRALFGWPFDWAIEPQLPTGLQQPDLQLPFEPNVAWVFTGGPHGGWDSGSAWAALDFAPPAEQEGCLQSEAWVVAMADGLILHAADGAVVQDLDGDGNPGTGWVLFYMHIEQRGRVAAGAYLRAGERIGHPSCEGGISTGTHLHIARLYNGEWIPADGNLPFVLDGWVSAGTGSLYNGTLTKDGRILEACECRESNNTIQR